MSRTPRTLVVLLTVFYKPRRPVQMQVLLYGLLFCRPVCEHTMTSTWLLIFLLTYLSLDNINSSRVNVITSARHSTARV